jgi:hypothetical protein
MTTTTAEKDECGMTAEQQARFEKRWAARMRALSIKYYAAKLKGVDLKLHWSAITPR